MASALVAGLETDFHRGFKSACGTGNQVAKRVSQCMDQVFELVEGKVPKPKNDQDLQATCDRFSFAERCIRSNSKDCLSGIHRTTVGSVSNQSIVIFFCYMDIYPGCTPQAASFETSNVDSLIEHPLNPLIPPYKSQVSAATKRFRLKECSSPATRAKYANAVECTNKVS